MKKEIIIEGLDCEHCVTRIKSVLRRVGGIEEVTVNPHKKVAQVTARQDIPDSVLREAIENDEAGYDVVEIRVL